MSIEKKDDTGFKISDRRIAGKDISGERDSAPPKTETPPDMAGARIPESGAGKEQAVSEGQNDFPTLDFPSLILSLYTSALIQMGEMENPATKTREPNLSAAKQTIDLITLLKEKTKGNLTPAEQNVIDQVLYELRMRYIQRA